MKKIIAISILSLTGAFMSCSKNACEKGVMLGFEMQGKCDRKKGDSKKRCEASYEKRMKEAKNSSLTNLKSCQKKLDWIESMGKQ